jgi:hypothetical protein
MIFSTRGVRRIGLTSLNPMVCLSSQSESDPMMEKAIRSEKMFIKSDPMLKFVIRPDPNLNYYIQRALIIRCMNVFFHDRKRYIGNNKFPAKISRYESDKNCRARHNLYALEHLHVNRCLFFIRITVEKND